MKVTIIAAIGKDRELGLGNELLWRIPDDLKRFRDLSRGHPVIMGRVTFDSIVKALGKPLPGRTSIVITRDPERIGTYRGQSDVIAALSIDDAIKSASEAPGSEEIIIAGGAQIYELALPFTDMLRLTIISDEKPADSFFPPYDTIFPRVLAEEKREWNGLSYRWVDLTHES
jgi:dihydrofolate reductase